MSVLDEIYRIGDCNKGIINVIISRRCEVLRQEMKRDTEHRMDADSVPLSGYSGN